MSVYTVMGAGNGGKALAAILKKEGHEVRLWNRSSERLNAIHKQNGIEISGQVAFHATIDTLTTDIHEATEHAKIIFVVVPAFAHLDIAKILAPHVKNDQVIVLNPGRTAGGLEVRTALARNGCKELPCVLETQSLFCACRDGESGSLDIISFKRDNTISSIPRDISSDLRAELGSIYRNLIVAPSSLHTSLENIGAILHPAPVLLNTGWIESRDVFFPHYYYGISKSVANFLERLDDERIKVAQEYGVSVRSVKKWHEDNYGFIGYDLFDTLQKNSSYASIDAPRYLTHRYITEDIPTGLVPISELGRAAGVKTPLVDMIIELGSELLNTDFLRAGRNLMRLGLEGKSVEQIIQSFQ